MKIELDDETVKLVDELAMNYAEVARAEKDLDEGKIGTDDYAYISGKVAEITLDIVYELGAALIKAVQDGQ